MQSLRRGSAAGKSARFTFPGAPLDIVVEVVCRNIARESRLHTDESNLCWEYALREFLEGLCGPDGDAWRDVGADSSGR